jgi:hypothetical protein
MDTLKGAAGKAVDWAKTKGTNLTTKVTADKLLQAWKKAGSPTDSLDVASIIQQAGVPSDSIKQVYSTMKIPFAGEKGAGADTARKIDVDPSSVAPRATTTPASTPTASATTPTTDTAQTTPNGPFAQVQELIAKLDPESKTKLVSTLKQELSLAEGKINELSNEKLGQYKKAAGADAKKADSEGDYKRGDKRFSGIVRATKKQFDNDKKQVKEFAPVGGDDREPDEEEILRQLAAKWWLGTEQEMAKAQKTLEVMGWEIGQDESGDDDAGVFVIRAGDENGDSYIAFNHSDLEELNEAYNNYHANRTGFIRPKRDLSGEGEPQGMFMVMIDGRPWKEFTSNVAFARAKTLADKNPTKKIQVRWPNGQLNTVKGNVDEGRYDSDDYYNPRMSRDYGARNLHTDSGAYEFEKNVPAGEPGGDRGRPQNLKGISKSLPADAFGRTTGKIPAGKPGRVHSMMRDIDEEQLDELSCWSGYHRVAGTKAGFPGSCAKNKTNEQGVAEGLPQTLRKVVPGHAKREIDKKMDAGKFGKTDADKDANFQRYKKIQDKLKEQGVAEGQHSCPHCGGEMVSEELMNEKKDACYYKVKSRYKVWPSAYASGALVKCRKKGADSWGNGGKKNEGSILEGINRADESLHDWFNKEKWVRMDTKGNIKGPCAKEPGEGKPKCLPQSKAHSLGKKGRASAAQRKRREDPNPERSGPAINVNTKKKANEEALDEKWSQKYKNSINCSNPKGFSQKAHCAGKNK